LLPLTAGGLPTNSSISYSYDDDGGNNYDLNQELYQ
jgi:hypothetical protein